MTKNVELNELGLTDGAIKALLSKKQNPVLVSQLMEHPDFTNLINAIDVYVRQLAAPSIGAVNNMIRIAERGIEGFLFRRDTKTRGI